MNLLGYDAMAVGNHEFDNSSEILGMQEGLALFPFLSANIYDEASGTRLFTPYTIFDVNGLDIAVVGFTTHDTPNLANPDFVAGIEFRDPKLEAATLLTQIETNDDPDLIFAVTHMGHYANGNSGSNAPGDVALAESLPNGQLDMIVGGHSQNPVCMLDDDSGEYADFNAGDSCTPDQKNGTWIVQAFEWGKYVGRADFEYLDGNLTLVSYQLIPVNLNEEIEDEDGKGTGEYMFFTEEIAEDPTALALLKPYQDKGGEELNVIIADTDAKLEGDREVVRSQQTNLGRLIATAQRDFINGASFGIMNSGGVRASIEVGDITYGDVLTVQPFGNSVGNAVMTGTELLDYLNNVATKTAGSGAYAQFAGIKMTVNCGESSVTIHTIGADDEPFDPITNADTEYSFTIPSFNASGGDKYPVIDEFIDSGFIDAQVLAEFMAELGTIVTADFEPGDDIKYINNIHDPSNDKGCAAPPSEDV